VNRERGVSHYGIGRTFRVFFDLLTIRFLLRYLSRPLHFFGRRHAQCSAGWRIGSFSCVEKFFYHFAIMEAHGPLMMFAAVLILAGVQLVALGLLERCRCVITTSPPSACPIRSIASSAPK